VFLGVGLVIWLTYLLQWAAPALVFWAPALLWAGLSLFAACLALRPSRDGAGPLACLPALPPRGIVRAVVCYALCAYALVYLVRLDFDGDFFTNWLPQARSHYFLGAHQPQRLSAEGAVHAATYPPGYGITLSSLLWAADAPRDGSFLIGPDTSYVILLYRLLIFLLNAALLVGVGTYLSKLQPAWAGTWLVGLVALLLLVPTTAGKHIAAETLLFPMLAAAIVLIAAGQSLGIRGLTALGLAVGALATLVKWEAVILFAVGVLPWLVSSVRAAGRPSLAVVAGWVLLLAAALAPTLLWKRTLNMDNGFFAPVTWAKFSSSVPVLGRLAFRALQQLLEDGRFLLLLALPAAVAVQLWASRRLAALVAPLSVVALFAGWVVVFAFSNLEPLQYLSTSYSRLVMVPTFAAILYCSEAACSLRWRGEA
jgi:hypothetical protein